MGSRGIDPNDSVMFLFKVSSCGMSDTIGPIHIKERPSSEMQSRIDAEVCFWYLRLFMLYGFYFWFHNVFVDVLQVVKLLREAYDRVKALLKKVCSLFMMFYYG